jgi:transposase
MGLEPKFRHGPNHRRDIWSCLQKGQNPRAIAEALNINVSQVYTVMTAFRKQGYLPPVTARMKTVRVRVDLPELLVKQLFEHCRSTKDTPAAVLQASVQNYLHSG